MSSQKLFCSTSPRLASSKVPRTLRVHWRQLLASAWDGFFVREFILFTTWNSIQSLNCRESEESHVTRENKFRTTSHQFFGNTLSPLSAFVCCLQHSWDELRGAGNANRREVIISLSLLWVPFHRWQTKFLLIQSWTQWMFLTTTEIDSNWKGKVYRKICNGKNELRTNNLEWRTFPGARSKQFPTFTWSVAIRSNESSQDVSIISLALKHQESCLQLVINSFRYCAHE